jgi:hypothetical protein
VEVTQVDHRIDITVAGEGADPATGDRLLGALHEVLPTADAVIDQNIETGDLTATFVVDGESTGEAAKRGIDVFALAADRAGMDSLHTVAIAAAALVSDEGPGLAAV